MDLRGFGLSDEDLRQLGYQVEGRAGGPLPERGPEGAGRAPPRKKWQPTTRLWLATVTVLLGVGWAAGSNRRLPSPVPVGAPDTIFSSARAMAQLVEVAQRPRPTGSPESRRVRELLLGRLASLGLEPEVQTTTAFVRDSSRVRAATVHNVVARIAGSAPTGAVLLAAHYDTSPLSPGAADDGVGVATLLETVRAVLAGVPPRNDLIVLFTDGDELGLLGSRGFAAEHRWMPEVAVVLSVEGSGRSGPALLFETGVGNGRLVEAFAETERRPAALSLARVARPHAVESSEADALLRGGLPGATFAVVGDRALQHLARDTRDRLSESAIQHGGRQLLALTRSMAALDLSDELAAPDRVYQSLPWIGLVHYPRSWVLPTGLLFLVFWTLVGLVLRGRRARASRVALGVAAGATVVGVSALAGRTLLDFVSDMHPEYGALTTALYEDSVHAWAIVGLAVAISCIVYAVVRRWTRTDELVFGGITVVLLYASWLALWSPFAAPALQLPLAGALLAGALVIVAGPNRARSAWAWVLLLLLASATLLVAVPSLELLATLWTFRAAAALGALIGGGTLLLWPLMDRLLTPRAWWTPLAALAVTSGLVIVALPAFRSPDEHPVPTTLVYLTDEPVGSAAAGGPAGAPADSSRVRTMAGQWLTVPGPGEAWARSWAGEAATGDTRAGVLLIGSDSTFTVVGTAPVAELAPPRATVEISTMEGARRRVELLLEPGLEGEMTGIHLPEGSPAAIVGVGAARWDVGAAPVTSLTHWGAPDPAGLHLGLEVEAAVSEIVLEVIEHHMRPREVLGTYFFQRPDSMIANAASGSDRAIQRTTLRVPLD